VLQLAEKERVELCMAPPMLDEVVEVLQYAKLQSRIRSLNFGIPDLTAYIVQAVTFFEIKPGPPVVVADPDDDVFLWCAIAADAAYVVTGDQHLLELGSYAGIPIIGLREFLDSLVSAKCT
jgi:putative PIN family toxin of toxin-antitoxin system